VDFGALLFELFVEFVHLRLVLRLDRLQLLIQMADTQVDL
jgi:hypothetical protein